MGNSIRNIFAWVIVTLLFCMELFIGVIYADAPFEPNVRVNELVPILSPSAQCDPSVAVDNTGNIYIVWEDARDGNLDVFFTKSADGGNTFSTDRKVNGEIADAWHFNPSITVDGTGNIYIAWRDDRNGDSDIYFSKSTDGGNTFSYNRKVNDDVAGAEQDCPSIAVDGAGNVYLAWMDLRNGDSDIYFANSTDGGNTFSANKKVDDDISGHGQTLPQIATDNSDKIYIVWIDHRNGDFDVYFANSTDGGNTFSPNRMVNDDGVNAGQFKPSIAADGTGSIYITWMDRRNGDYDVYFASSTDGGNIFSPNRMVNDDAVNAEQDCPSIAVDKGGNIYLSWADNRNGNNDIFFANSTDGGTTFSTNKKVNDDVVNAWQYECSLGADGAGNVYIAWGDDRDGNQDIYFTKSADGGNTFLTNKKANDELTDARQFEPSIAVDGTDRIYIAWRDDRNGDYDIYFANSTDDGNTFSAGKKVNDDFGNAGQYEPSLGVDGAGNIYLAWRDVRNGDSDIYFSKSIDGGTTFSSNKKVNDDIVNAGQYAPSLGVDGAGNIYIAWRDDRNGNPDIYFTKSTDGGTTFSTNKKVNDDVVNAWQNFTSIAVDGASNIYIVWEDDRNGDFDIYFSKSTDQGTSFSTNKKVNDDIVNAGQYEPSLGVDGAGNVHTAWRDGRNGDYDIYFANSVDGGNTFSTNKKVNDDVGSAQQSEPSIELDAACNIHIAWTDRRNGDYDIYFANSVDGGNTFSKNSRVNDDIGSAERIAPSTAVGDAGGIYVAWTDTRSGISDIYFTKTGPIPAVMITEIKDSPDGSEWVEVYNPGLLTINLLDHKMSLDLGGTFTDGSWGNPVINLGEYSVWTPSIIGVLNDEGAMISIHNFSDPAKPMLDVIGYGQSGPASDPLTGESCARYWDSSLSKYKPSWSRNGTTGPTPGAVNNAPGVNSTPLVILNEVRFNPLSPQYGFIELIYIGDKSIDISDYKIVCDSEFVIPGGTILNMDYPYFGINQPDYPPDFDLDNGVANGDNVYLYNETGTLLDMVGWSSSHTVNLSISRVPDGFGTYQGFNDTTSEEAGWSFNWIPSFSLINILPDYELFCEKGDSIAYNLTIKNIQIHDDMIDITYITGPWGFEVIILDEYGAPPTDSNGNGIPDIFVSAGGLANITVVVTCSDEIPLMDYEITPIAVQSTVNPWFADVATLVTKVYPYIMANKTASPKKINMLGAGYGEEATITLNVTGSGFGVFRLMHQDVVLCIDSSESMQWSDPDGLRKEAAKNYVDNMRIPDTGAVVDFDDDAILLHNLSTNYTQIKEDIDAIDSNGGTAVGAGLQCANNELIANGPPGHDRVIILLTDGYGIDNALALSEAIRSAEKDTRIYTIGLGDSVDEVLLKEIANITGGQYFHAETAEDLEGIYEIIGFITHIAGVDTNTTDANPMIRDVLPSWINYVPGSFSIQPNATYVDDRGYTFMEWNVSEILINQSWSVTFNITSTMLGPQLTNEVQTSRVNYTNWNNESITSLFPETRINVVIGEPSPPELFIDVLPDGRGDDVRLSWIPPSELNITHYLIYKSEDQTNFNFTDVWIDTSKDEDPVDGLIIPHRTTFNHTGAAKPGHMNHSQEWYYVVRAVNSLGKVSDTSRTVGKWTKTFQQGVSTFSLPLEPLETMNTTIDHYLKDMNAAYIRWMDPANHIWLKHGDGVVNDTLLEVGKGYEVSFDSYTNYTFTGMPGAMIRYDDDDGFTGFDPDTDARNLTATVDPFTGNITLSWTKPSSKGVNNQYHVLRSLERDGFWNGNYVQLATLAFDELTYTDIGNATAGTQFYYMIVPVNETGVEGASTYSIGVWTANFSEQYDTIGMPLKIVNNETVDWYCDNIPDTVGINYYNVGAQRWSWHSTRMPKGAFDPVVVMTGGYQISISGPTKFTFIGW